MLTSFYLKKADEASQELLRKHLTDKKQIRLTRLLRHGSLGVADFRVRVDNSAHRKKFFSVNLTLNIGKKKLVAEKRGMNLLEVFDLAFNKIIFQLRKLEGIRHDT